jgi:glycosyltransferase involved in cell wall biosynthesis
MVSVIIPVFNRTELCLEALRSVAAQSVFSEIEIIVVDDGSTENMDVVKRLVSELNGQFVRQENRGVSAARNVGICRTRGEFIAFLDSDDLWMPEKIKTQLEYFRDNPEIEICQTLELWFRNGKFVNPQLKHYPANGESFYRSLRLCCISPSSVMLRRSLLESVGVFDEALPVCEDYDLWLRITSVYPVGLIDKSLVRKRAGHNDQLSRSRAAMDRFRIYSMLKLGLTKQLKDNRLSELAREIALRARIIATGAKKRENYIRAELYLEIAVLFNHAENVFDMLHSDYQKVCVLLEQVKGEFLMDENSNHFSRDAEKCLEHILEH